MIRDDLKNNIVNFWKMITLFQRYLCEYFLLEMNWPFDFDQHTLKWDSNPEHRASHIIENPILVLDRILRNMVGLSGEVYVSLVAYWFAGNNERSSKTKWIGLNFENLGMMYFYYSIKEIFLVYSSIFRNKIRIYEFIVDRC